MVKIKEEIFDSDLTDHEVVFRTAESEKENENVQLYNHRSIHNQVRSVWIMKSEDVKPKIEPIDIDQSLQPVIRLDRDFLIKNCRENWIEIVKSTFRRPSVRKACQLCINPLIFDSASKLIDHYAELHGREVTLMQCKLCDFSSKKEEDILGHWENSHSSNRRENNEKYTMSKEVNQPDNVWIGDDELVRSIYPKYKKYASVEEREEHAKDVVECKVCLKKLSKYYIRAHMVLHDTEMHYKCDYCDKSFKFKQNIRSHMVVHMSEKKFECKVCFKKFSRLLTLKMHEIIHFKETLPKDDPRIMRRKHELELVECGICKAKVGRKSLFLHKKTHIEELPHKCEKCGKSFRRKASLKEHMITHLYKKPFACKQCPKTFGQRRGLEHHELVHLKGILPDDDPRWKWADYKKKTVECDICFKKINAYSLKHHQRIHDNEKPFKCDVCTKTFRLKAHLGLHIKIHTQPKPQFKCAFCDYKFRTESYLKVHERKHREGKPACQFCKKEFESNADVLRHVRTVHYSLLRQQDKRTGELNELFQGYRTFECYKCNFTSIFREVEKHMKKCHTEDYFVQCDKCVRKFESKTTYKRHLKIHDIKKNMIKASERTESNDAQ